MPKMIFQFQVKYQGRYFPANKPFEVKDEDVKSMLSEGGKLLKEDKKMPEDSKKSFKKRG